MHQRHVPPGKEGEEPWHCQHRADLRLLLLQPQPKGESIRKGFSCVTVFTVSLRLCLIHLDYWVLSAQQGQ